MSGETDLQRLIRGMNPELNPGEYAFCSVEDMTIIANLQPVGFFREKEGLSIILTRDEATENNIPYTFVSAWITLNIHSALEAVGLTAAISKALTDENISCNIVAGYYHDHLFVPYHEGMRALTVIKKLIQL